MEKTQRKGIRNGVTFILFLLFLCTTGTTFYFYQKAKEVKMSTETQPQNEAAELVSKVSKIILLPEGELPTIATVSNPEELQSQPFFAKAKVGDKVLLYQVAKKAYLYDPVANKIIEVSSINPETQ